MNGGLLFLGLAPGMVGVYQANSAPPSIKSCVRAVWSTCIIRWFSLSVLWQWHHREPHLEQPLRADWNLRR